MAWKIRLLGKKRRFKVGYVHDFDPDGLDISVDAGFLYKKDAEDWAKRVSRETGGWAFVASGYKRPVIESVFRKGKRVSLNTWYTLLMFDSGY